MSARVATRSSQQQQLSTPPCCLPPEAAAAAASPPHMAAALREGGPVPASARVGRHQQRYGEQGERLVAGCIPIRFPGASPTVESVEVMLITSRGGKGWVFPKGGWEDDETLEAAARRETVEEAGVRGSIEEPLLGTFCFTSAKQERVHNVHQGRCRAYMFVMRVAEELEMWPEWPDRQRCWVPLAEASSRCRHQWMRDALATWVARLPGAQPAAADAEQQQEAAAAQSRAAAHAAGPSADEAGEGAHSANTLTSDSGSLGSSLG